MDNQVDYINLAPTAGAEQIAAGAAQFATALGGAAANIGAKFAEKEKLRQKAIADATKEKNKTRASIRKENEKRRREGQGYLAEKGQDTLDYEAESKRLGELANEAEFMLTPPYSDGYSREELEEAQKQVDEFFNYINTSKAAGGKVEAAIASSNEIENSGGLQDRTNGYTHNVKEIITITDAVSYTNNSRYNDIASNYFTKKTTPSGWEVKASNKSEKGQSISSYTFIGPNNESFVYTIDGSNTPLEFSTLIGDPALNDGIKTIRNEKGDIDARFQYSSSASMENVSDNLQRINEFQMIDMDGVETEFKDQVRGNVQGAFLDGKLGLLNYFAQNADKIDQIDEVIKIYESDNDDNKKVDRLTNLIFTPMFEEFQGKFNPREATDEDIKAAEQAGITLRKVEGKKYVYSMIKTGDVKQKRKETGDEQTVVEENTQMIKDNWLKSGQELATPNRKFVGVPVDANGKEIQDRSQIPVGYRLMTTGTQEGTTKLMPVSSTDKIYKNVNEFLGAIGRMQKFEGLNTN